MSLIFLKIFPDFLKKYFGDFFAKILRFFGFFRNFQNFFSDFFRGCSMILLSCEPLGAAND